MDVLDAVEARILGCLMEKEMATPEYYPLSLNALTNACNQKSNREPVVSFDETTVLQGLDRLVKKKLVWRSDASRVVKFNENFVKLKNLLNKEAALMTLLLVRGPQTPGELRGRSERLYSFTDLDEVERCLTSLIEMEMVVKLEKQPGRKECRFAHLLAGDPVQGQIQHVDPGFVEACGHSEEDLASLQQQIEELRQEIALLKEDFSTFRQEFE